MRNNLYFFIALLVLFVSCESSSSLVEGDALLLIADTQQEINSLNGHLSKYEEPSQLYSVSSAKPIEIKGIKGTIISVNPSDLEAVSGQPLGKEIKIELRELTNQAELLGSRAQTVSNNQLLISGGAYYIALTSNGEELKLKQGKTLKVAFPKFAKEEMALFYGQRDSLGLMNWQEAEDLLISVASESDLLEMAGSDLAFDTGIESEYSEFYQAIGISSLGWINCDRFFETEEKAGLWVKSHTADSASTAKVFLVFRSINSVMEGHYDTNVKGDSILMFDGLPVGYETRLIAFMKRGDKTYAHASDVTIRQNQAVELKFKPVTEQELKLLISK